MGAARQQEIKTPAEGATNRGPDLPIIIPSSESIDAQIPNVKTRLLAWLRTGTGMFSGVISLLAATLTVLFLLVPSLKPDGPTTAFSASMSDARIETDVALADYYVRRREQPDSTLSGSDLQRRGVVISYTVVIEGYKGKKCTVFWSVYDAATNKRSQTDWLVAQEGWPVGTFTPEGNVDQSNGEIWVPNPPTAGDYFVRLELNDPDGTRVATLDSPTFTATGNAVAPVPVGLPTSTGG